MLLEIEVQGARQVRETLPDAAQIFIRPPSDDALRDRLVGRGTDTPSRSSVASHVAGEELAAAGEFKHVVVNDRLDEAVDQLGGDRAGYTGPVISPRIDKLLDHVDSNYASVLVAAKRARQINSYYHNLGEGTFDEFPPPMVETVSKNYLTIALEEVAAGKIKYQYR